MSLFPSSSSFITFVFLYKKPPNRLCLFRGQTTSTRRCLFVRNQTLTSKISVISSSAWPSVSFNRGFSHCFAFFAWLLKLPLPYASFIYPSSSIFLSPFHQYLWNRVIRRNCVCSLGIVQKGQLQLHIIHSSHADHRRGGGEEEKRERRDRYLLPVIVCIIFLWQM